MTTVVLETGFVVEVVAPPLPVVEHIAPTDGSAVLVDPRPPAGGGAAASGYAIEQLAPSAQWSFPNPTRRLCGVDVYTSDGEQVEADVWVTPSLITVTFPSPTSGVLVAT